MERVEITATRISPVPVDKAGPKSAADYAYTPDKGDSSTWKLPIHDAAHCSAAAAALSSGGFRGQKVDIPKEALEGVKAKVRAAWQRHYPDKGAEDMPESIRKFMTTEPPPIEPVYIDPTMGSTFGEIMATLDKQVEKEYKSRRASAGFGAAYSLYDRALKSDSDTNLDVDSLLRELAVYLKGL